MPVVIHYKLHWYLKFNEDFYRCLFVNAVQTIVRYCGIYRLVMVSIDLSETAHFAHWKSETTSETNFFVTKFFSNKKFFFSYFVSDWIFCLGLNFASDYIPQLYFVFNHLLYLYCLLSFTRRTMIVYMVTIRSVLRMVHMDTTGSYHSSVDKRNTAGNIHACALFSRLKFKALEININLTLKF